MLSLGRACESNRCIVPSTSQIVHSISAMNSLNSCPGMMKKCPGEKGKEKISAARSSEALSCELLIQNHSNFKRSACPKRFMFYENGSWVDYQGKLAEVMKLGFVEGKSMVEVQVLGFNCFVDFCRMLEIELHTGNHRSISWIDINGRCFFPKFFVNSSENGDEDDLVNFDKECPKIQIDVKIRENSGSCEGLEFNKSIKLSKRKREDEAENENMEVSSVNAERRPMVRSKSGLASWQKARILGAEEKAYAIIKNLFLSGLEIVDPGAEVTSIHQCVRMGPLDQARCKVFAKQIEITKRARGQSNVVFAWHGTSSKGVESILMHGFGVPSELSHSEGHGIGIYLSPIRIPGNSAMLSEIDGNGEKHVILCRVILGKCEKVDAGSRQLYPSSVEYDTGVDDLNNTRWYTVWHASMSTHILPEYVVSYRPAHMTGTVTGVSNVNSVPHPSMLVAKLLSKLRSSLPLPRFQELQTLWGSCKEGKLGKDTFMKQLRAVVGDHVLRSAIQEIRG